MARESVRSETDETKTYSPYTTDGIKSVEEHILGKTKLTEHLEHTETARN